MGQTPSVSICIWLQYSNHNIVVTYGPLGWTFNGIKKIHTCLAELVHDDVVGQVSTSTVS